MLPCSVSSLVRADAKMPGSLAAAPFRSPASNDFMVAPMLVGVPSTDGPEHSGVLISSANPPQVPPPPRPLHN